MTKTNKKKNNLVYDFTDRPTSNPIQPQLNLSVTTSANTESRKQQQQEK